MSNEKGNRINCFNCKHFAVSWDPMFPKRCKLYGFKTTMMPSVQVMSASGEECMGYEEKTKGHTP